MAGGQPQGVMCARRRWRAWCAGGAGAFVLAGLAGGGALGACGGGTTGAGGGDAATAGDAGGTPDQTAGVPVACAGDAGAVSGYVSPASGTIAGSGVGATICGAEAYLYESPYTTPRDDYLFYLDSVQSSAFTVQSPAQASYPLLDGMMQVPAASPGVYASGPGTCGFLTFSYSLPVPAGIDCGDAPGPDCPPGCGSVCSGFGCDPCTPEQPEVGYSAMGPGDCLGDTQAAAGSWTVTLTSVEPYTGSGDDNGPHYVTHGTVTGTLPDEEGGTETVTLTVSF